VQDEFLGAVETESEISVTQVNNEEHKD